MSQDQNANGELEEQRDFESLLLDLSVRFVNVSADQLDQEINEALRHICQFLNLDLGTLWEQSPDESHVLLMTHVYRPLGGAPIPERLDASVYFPWNAAENQARKTVVISSLENLSEETVSCDLASWRYFLLRFRIGWKISILRFTLLGAALADSHGSAGLHPGAFRERGRHRRARL